MSKLTKLPSGSYVDPDDPGEPGHKTGRVSVTESEARLLAALAYNRWVLEVGTGLGISTRALARFARRVDTVDVDPWVEKEIVPNLTLRYSNVKFHPSLSRLEHLSFNLIFIDGNHNPDQVQADLQFARGHLLEGGLIVLHDANYPNVGEGVSREGIEMIRLQTAHGLGVIPWEALT